MNASNQINELINICTHRIGMVICSENEKVISCGFAKDGVPFVFFDKTANTGSLNFLSAVDLSDADVFESFKDTLLDQRRF